MHRAQLECLCYAETCCLKILNNFTEEQLCQNLHGPRGVNVRLNVSVVVPPRPFSSTIEVFGQRRSVVVQSEKVMSSYDNHKPFIRKIQSFIHSHGTMSLSS